MYNIIVKETEQAVLEHFNGLRIDGVGYERTTPKVVWSRYQHSYSDDYFTIVSREDSNTISWETNVDEHSRTISYSLDDGNTWFEETSSLNGTFLADLNNGDKILIKAENIDYFGYDSGLEIEFYNYFNSTGYYDIEGNIMSLIAGDEFRGLTALNNGNNFSRLFNDKLCSAANLILPATTLVDYCYREMFLDCTSLTTAPELPATTLADLCYYGMFWGCTSLTTAPELPATTLAGNCYGHMFADCTSLTTAPELPATTLAGYCYDSMFWGCTSLTTAPELPVTTLYYGCYTTMFGNCTNLATAPELPATTLPEYCYNGMFSGCTSLTAAPELPATALTSGCYRFMFWGCTNLNYIKCLASTGMTGGSLENWVNGVAQSGTFIKSPNATTGSTAGASQWRINNTYGIPSGWTVVDAS